MRKAILCIALVAAFSISAFAPEVPSEMIVRSLNGSQQAIRIYILPPKGDPQELIEESFVLEGCLYAFADTVKTENRVDDIRAETETVTVGTTKDDLSLILEQLALIINYDDGQYQDTLTLDHTTIRTGATGYTTEGYTVTATKTIGLVDRNGMSYVPATTAKDDRTLNLSSAEWQVTGTKLVGGVLMPSSYQVVATHSGAASYGIATSYVTTADCAGEVSCDEVESTIYQLTYLGEADASVGSEDGPWPLPVLPTRWPCILGGIENAALLILVTLLLRSRREIRRLRSEQESMLLEDDDEEEKPERGADPTIS